jgi:plastocyanin
MIAPCIGGLVSFLAANASAEGLPVFRLHIKNAVFSPATIEVPAGEKFKLMVENEGPSAEEFESAELNREKVVGPGQAIALFIGPLSPGTYGFFGDFHRDTAKGNIVAKAVR